jgi:hypothetical protein
MQLLSYQSDATNCLRPRSTAAKSAGKAVGNSLSQYIPLLNLGLSAASEPRVTPGARLLSHAAAIAGSEDDRLAGSTIYSAARNDFSRQAGMLLVIVREEQTGLTRNRSIRVCILGVAGLRSQHLQPSFLTGLRPAVGEPRVGRADRERPHSVCTAGVRRRGGTQR